MKKHILLVINSLLVTMISAQVSNQEKDEFAYEKIEILNQKTGELPLEGVSDNSGIANLENKNNSGIGETIGELSVSLTGAAEYTIPIAVPRGINGVEPQIALKYNNQSGNGTAGYGWNIDGISQITRVPSTEFHDGIIDGVDFDNLDRFALDGQRLLLKSGVYGANGAEYQTENYSNLKIVSYGVSPYGGNYGPEYFEIHYPDGAFARYGSNSNSSTRIVYAITYWQNPHGVRINYEYENLESQFRIKKIKYGALFNGNPINEIVFDYSLRSRKEQMFVKNFQFYKTKRVNKIRVLSEGTQYRRYDINFNSSILHYDLLDSVTEYSGDNSENHSSITFGYGLEGSNTINYSDVETNLTLENIEQRNAEAIPLDITGNGKMDFLVYPKEDKTKFWLFKDIQNGVNNGATAVNTGAFETIFPTTLLNHQNKLFSGQGLTIVQNSGSSQVKFKVYSNGVSSGPIQWQYTKSWNSPTATNDNSCTSSTEKKIDKHYVSGDFNGDGLTDVIAIQKPYSVQNCSYQNCDDDDGDGNFPIADPNEEENYQLGDDNLIEMGKSPDPIGDTCCQCTTTAVNSSKAYFIDLNRNLTSNYVNYSGTLQLSVDDEDKLLSADFNGDGKSDILHVKEGKLFVYSLNDNNNLYLLWQLADTDIKLEDVLLTGDFNGDGKTDLLDPEENNSASFNTFYSTGTQFLKMTKNQPFTYKKTNLNGSNGVLSGFNLIPIDINGDGKTDIIEYNTVTYNGNSNGTQTIKGYRNVGIGNTDSSQFYNVNLEFSGTTSKTGNLKHFPIPIFLTNQSNKNLEFASISNQWVTNFSFNIDHRENVELKQIYNNGKIYHIAYNSLDEDHHNDYNMQVYESSNEVTYPNVDINVSPGTKIVSMLRLVSADSEQLTRLYTYEGAVYHQTGLGFLGFNRIAESNWHSEHANRIFTVAKYDPLLRGALVEKFVRPYDYFNSNGYIVKTTYQNSHTLLPNKVFKLQVNSTSTDNALALTYENVTFQYDNYNNPTYIHTNHSGFGSTTINRSYSNNESSNFYIGRLASENTIQSVGSESFSTYKEFVYSGYNLSQIKSKGNGTPYDYESFQYDIFGNVTKKIVTPNGMSQRENSFEFDSSGRFLTKMIDTEGLETVNQYQYSTGNLLSETNPYGLITNYEYDVWNRLIKVINYLGKESTTSYVQTSNRYTVTHDSDDGSSIKQYYDVLQRLIKVSEKDVLGQWINVSFEYDDLGRPWKQSEPYIGDNPTSWNETSYDFYNRPTSQLLHTGRQISINYSGLMVTVNDGVKTMTSNHNAMGNVTSVTDPGGTINYTYYGNGALKSTNYNGVIISREQDGWGRKTKLIDPSAGTYEYTYNGFGELLTETTPKGETTITYSNVGRLQQKVITGDHTDMTLQYTYDPNHRLLTNLTLTSADGNNANYSYAYDNYIRLTNVTETNMFAQFKKDYTYDDFGRIETENSFAKLFANNKTSSKKVKNEYQNGILKSTKDFSSNVALWNIDAINARGQLTTATLGNGLSVQNTFDSYGYSTSNSIESNASGSPVELMQLTYNFDEITGNLNSRTNSLFSWSETFDYDNLDRLVNFNDNNGNNNHVYDDFGRITSNNTIGDYNYTGTFFQLANIDLNNQGDLYYQQYDLQRITYNAFKKAYEINEVGKEKIGFQYNAFLGRSHMFYGDTEDDILLRNNRKHYSFDGSMEISYDLSAGKTEFVTYIGGDAYSSPVIWRSEQDGNTQEEYFYLHRDYLGSILMVTDSSGDIQEKRHFDAWGNIVKLTDANDVNLEKFKILDRGYTGHEHLQDVKLIHMNGRLYDPKLHRFLSPDNFIQDITNTQNYNRYGYVLNNPLKYTDPTGEMTDPDLPGSGGGEGGGISPEGQSFLGNWISSLYYSLQGAQIGRWLGTNFKSAIRDVSNFVREIGRGVKKFFGNVGKFFKGLFGKRNKENPIKIINNSNNLLSDPMAHSSSAMSQSSFGVGVNTGLKIAITDPIDWFLKQAKRTLDFGAGFADGFKAGGASTWKFLKSLGTKKGWTDFGHSLEQFAHFASPTPSPYGMYLRAQAADSAISYVKNIPNMTAYEIGHDVGYGTEKIVEGVLLTKGTGFALNTARYGLSSLKIATGGTKQWLRLGNSYSIEGGFRTYGLRWGASPRYLGRIGSIQLRGLNRWFRSTRIPGNHWRFSDPGHFHFWRR